uniref:Uncharacterized protein n=1 Tax=Tanacetum cinerariifolium TaxID=118510 RepID=A0A6L2MD95_TANCI|nr:hypothetical protein [Tanacetum cinerariifolium]
MRTSRCRLLARAGTDVDVPSPCVWSMSMAARVTPQRAMLVPISVNFSPKGKEVIVSPSCGSKRKILESLGGSGPSPIFIKRRIGFCGPLASFEDTKEADPFLPGDDEAWFSHDVLSGLLHLNTQRRLDGLSLNELANFHDVSALKFMMSSNMLNREARSLSAEVLRLRDEVVTLKNQQANYAIVISMVEAKLLGVEGRLATSEDSVVRDLRAENEKLVSMLAIEDSLRVELEGLKEKLDLGNEDRSLIVTDMPPHAAKTFLSSDSFSVVLAGLQEKAMLVSRGQALKEVADMGIGLRLGDMRDYKSDVEETYDKAIDDFYQFKFPYLDLLAYHAKKSLGLLKSLKPPNLPLSKPSGVDPSSSPFI